MMSGGNGNGNGENPWLKFQQAMLDEGINNFHRLARIPYLYQHAQRVRKGATPAEVVYEEDRIKLLHYRSETEARYKTPLLFVFALVNRPYILDLKPGKSVVSHFVQHGFDTYLLDWGVPTQADRHLSLEDHISGYLNNVVEHMCERHGVDQVNILGYCMGGTMSTMYTSLNPKKVKNLVLMAAGIDFESRESLLQLWTDAKYFDVDKFVDVFGNAPAEFLQWSFLMLKPVQNLIEKPITFFERLDDEPFIDDFFAMEGWLNDNIPVPGEVYRQFVKYLYQQNLLVKGKMPVGKHLINLRNITCPVLNLMARKDDLVPCSQSQPFTDLVGSTDRKTIVFPAGHIGLAVGTKAQRELWPQVCDWLAERSDPVTEPSEARRA
jgi:polyhydroxyalkanoate synthase subunit PhaC